MAEKEDELSYEEISEIRRKEENSSYLSQVRPDFYSAATITIRRNTEVRNRILVENPELYDGISGRYKNLSALVERVIFIRSNKIWHNALRDASSGNPVIPENVTTEERELYTKLYGIAKGQFSCLNVNKTSFTPTLESVPVVGSDLVVEQAVADAQPLVDDGTEEFFPPQEEEPVPEIKPVAEEPALENPVIPPMEDVLIKDEEVLVRVLDDIPTFSGPERDYTLKKEDVVRLPSMMASALINRQKAVLIKTTP